MNWSTSTTVSLPAKAELRFRWTASDYTQCLPFFKDNGRYALQATNRDMTTGNTEVSQYNIIETTGIYRLECGGQKNDETGIDYRSILVTTAGSAVPPPEVVGGGSGTATTSTALSNTDWKWLYTDVHNAGKITRINSPVGTEFKLFFDAKGTLSGSPACFNGANVQIVGSYALGQSGSNSLSLNISYASVSTTTNSCASSLFSDVFGTYMEDLKGVASVSFVGKSTPSSNDLMVLTLTNGRMMVFEKQSSTKPYTDKECTKQGDSVVCTVS
jgi:hypothetical protein